MPILQWGICPECRKPLVKTDVGTMDFKPCREHPQSAPVLKDVCRLCKRTEVDDDSPVLNGFSVCSQCLSSHVASIRMTASSYLYREKGKYNG